MEICALASGSSGNCFYLGNKKDKKAIIIDAGISAKQIVERLEIIGKNPESIKAIFITHEHSDHIRGADVLARQFNIPIFATKKTIQNSCLCSDKSLINSIKNNETTKIVGLNVEAFSKSHRVADPVSYNIVGKRSQNVAVITDLGFCCKNTIEKVSEANALFIESKHDVAMLENGPYPYFLKKWIRSDTGHLSNMQASLCILEYGNKKLKNVILSHISKMNNTPELALHTMRSLLKERKDLLPLVSLSSREMPSELVKL